MRAMILSAGSDNEFPNPTLRIRSSTGILWRKPLVVVVVAIQNQLRVEVIQRLPECSDFQIIPVVES